MGMLELSDIVAWPDGMNLQAKPWAIETTQARYLQDIMLDKEEVAYMRGPVRQGLSPTLPTFATRAIGIVSTQDPADRWRVGVLTGDATHAYLQALNTDFDDKTQLNFDVGGNLFFKDTLYYRYSQSPFMKGGVLIGTQPWGEKRTQTGLALWGGGALEAYSTGQVEVAQDGTTVTGHSTAWDDGVNIEAGMYLYAYVDIATSKGKQYIGQIKSVDGATTLTLEEGALFEIDNGGAGRNYTIKSIRPLDRHVSKGQITCTTSSDVINGSGTKFKRQNLDSGGPWAIFRADDMKYVGKVSSVASDIQLTLTANANVTCNKEEFVAIDLTGDRSVNVGNVGDFGWITGWFAGRQWYANNPYSSKNKPHNESRVSFSRYFDPEAVDNTYDGDHIFIPNNKGPLHSITGLYGTPSCLLVTKVNETWGIFGTSEADFSPRWLHGDGALSPMVFQPFGEGVVWAGEKGIWFFDGQQVYPLIDDRIGDWYEKAVLGSTPHTYPAYSMIYKGNYILYVPLADPPYAPDTTVNDDNASEGGSQDYLAICVNLERRAVSMLTNLAFVGGVTSPAEEMEGTIYAVNHCDTTNPYAFNAAYLCRASDLFDDDLGSDTLNTQHVTAGDYRGPNLFIESGRYDLGKPQVKKRIKQLMGNFWVESEEGAYILNGNVTLSTNFGYETIGATAFDYPAGFKIASKFTTATALGITSIKAYLSGLGAGSGSQTFKAMIYSDNAGSPDALLATSSAVVITDGQAAGWVSFPVTYSAAAGTYWLGLIADNADQSAQGHYNAVGTNTYDVIGDAYGDGPSDPFGSGTLLNRTLSIYAVATDSSGEDDYANNYLNFATMVGLNDIAVTSNGKWRLTRAKNGSGDWVAGFQNRRVKFNKKSQFLGFKIWPSATNTGFQKVVFGAMALAYKDKRPGQV